VESNGIAVERTIMIPIATVVSALVTERAVAARAFVDSVGVNIHLHNNGTPYYDDFPTVKQRLLAAHIRHVRDGMIDTTWQPFYDRLNDLGAVGIHSTLVTNVKESVATIIGYPKRVAASIEAIEGPNEYDRSGDPNWPSTLVSFTRSLYSGVKANAATVRLPVIGPSLTSAAAFGAVGDLSGSMDQGNTHDYFAGFNPGTRGYGDPGFGSVYGSIAYARNIAAQTSRTRPIVSTESGYGTARATHANVSEAVQGKYIPRLLLEHYLHGIDRTFIYQLVDEGNDGFGAFGLLRKDLSAKPAFTAISAISNLLDARGPDRTDELRYEIAPAPDLAHVLFERPDGTFALAYWLEVPSWDVNAPIGGAPIAVVPKKVSLRFAQRIEHVVTYGSTRSGGFARTAIAGGTTLRVAATDAVGFILFRSAGRD